MPKVNFTHKNGREQIMSERYAGILKKVGRGTYMTRDMRAADPIVSLSIDPIEEIIDLRINEVPIDLDALDADALHAMAKDRGVKVHHKAGADKVRAALREAAE